METRILAIAGMLVLTGCAGSAQHEVVNVHGATDTALTCGQIDAETVRIQAITDNVNKDKEDISGADVLDGLLWFPFNLIAKSNNYKNSLEAADNRMAVLSELRKENGCSVADSRKMKEKSVHMATELSKLNDLHKSGALTDQEYIAAKQKALNAN